MPTISVIVGSVRNGRHGIKVANHVARELGNRGHKVHLVDPVVYPNLQQFKERYRFLKNPPEDLVKVSKILAESDGFIGVTPEYNYSYSPTIKQIFDLYLNEWKLKPLASVGYSMGPFAGVRAIEQLKLVSSTLAVPTNAYWAVPHVHTQFDEEGKLKDESHHKNLLNMLKEFEWYVTALANHRKADPSIVPTTFREVLD
jgi:NAD(P)H-dependent FMN reductase